MKVVVQGTKNFDSYEVFLRAMGVMLSDAKDDFIVYSVGPAKVNAFTSEFCNKAENTLRAKGIKVKQHFVPMSYVQDRMSDFDEFVFLSKPHESMSKLAALADLSGMNVTVFRY
jgi:sRNA-binding regulator protein Hfq